MLSVYVVVSQTQTIAALNGTADAASPSHWVSDANYVPGVGASELDSAVSVSR